MPAISYRFTATGADRVAAAYKSIQTAAEGAAKATEKSAKTATRAATTEKTAAKRRETLTQQSAERVQRDMQRRERNFARRRVRDRLREKQREIKATERLERQASRRQEALEARSHRRRVRRRYNRIRRFRERQAQTRMRRAQMLSRIGGGVRAAAGFGLVAAGAGAALVGAAQRRAMSTRDVARGVAIQARDAGGRYMDVSKLQASFQATAAATPGVTGAQVGKGVGAFIERTGDAGMALKLQKTIAQVSVSSGSSTDAIAKVMADAYQKFGIKSAAGMQRALAGTIYQGKAGAFEMADMAQFMPEMAASAARFGLKGSSGLSTLGGLAQLARQSTGSGAEASTSVSAMFRQLITKSGDIKKFAGADVFADRNKTKTRDIQDVIVETISGTGGNLQQLQKIFDVRGIRAISSLVQTFNQAGGGKAGEQALREQLKKSIGSHVEYQNVLDDMAIRQESAGMTMSNALDKLAGVAGPKLSGPLQELAKTVASFASTNAFDAIATAAGEMLVGLVNLAKLLKVFVPDRVDPKQTHDKAERRVAQLKNKRRNDKEYQRIIKKDFNEMTPWEREYYQGVDSEYNRALGDRNRARKNLDPLNAEKKLVAAGVTTRHTKASFEDEANKRLLNVRNQHTFNRGRLIEQVGHLARRYGPETFDREYKALVNRTMGDEHQGKTFLDKNTQFTKLARQYVKQVHIESATAPGGQRHGDSASGDAVRLGTTSLVESMGALTTAANKAAPALDKVASLGASITGSPR